MRLDPDFLLPLLPTDDGRPDADVLASWHAALAESVASVVPHDLLALWLYLPEGPLLVGPAALAEDRLEPPPATPHVEADAATAFGRIFERAKYLDTHVVPIAHLAGDVGLLVCASFTAAERVGRADALRRLAARLAPVLARLRRQCGGAAADPTATLGALLARLSTVPMGTVGVVHQRQLLEALRPGLPHEAAHLLLPDPDGWRLRVGDAERVVTDAELAALGLGGAAAIVPMASAHPLAAALAPDGVAAPLHLLGAPLVAHGRTVGRLLLVHRDPEAWATPELRLAGLVAPTLAALLAAAGAEERAVRAVAAAAGQRAVPKQLALLGEILATRRDPAAAWREFTAEATALLPFLRLRFAVRLGQADRVAIVTPGESRPLADLPQVPVAGTPLGELLAGERPSLQLAEAGLIEHGVPLRVHGELIGAMLIGVRPGDGFQREHRALLQQVADQVAPYFALARRPGGAGAVVGWKATGPRET